MPNSNLIKKIFVIPDILLVNLRKNNQLINRVKNYISKKHLNYYDLYNIKSQFEKTDNNSWESLGGQNFYTWVISTIKNETRKDKNRRKTLSTYTDNPQIKSHTKYGNDAETVKKIYETIIITESQLIQYKKIKNEI